MYPTRSRLGVFLSTPSGWRATRRFENPPISCRYFYPRPPGGGRRRARRWQSATTANFYPRPPGGGRQQGYRRRQQRAAHFYPRPPGGGRRKTPARPRGLRRISIHALRVEGDKPSIAGGFVLYYFYPRPPGGGRPRLPPGEGGQLIYFYPRPPGGGRHKAQNSVKSHEHFYPRPPGGGRPRRGRGEREQTRISIHALRVEGDAQMFPVCFIEDRFLSTPSGWRATSKRTPAGRRTKNFYPRPPGGGRRQKLRTAFKKSIFLSTPSGWRATIAVLVLIVTKGISIHALRVEGDRGLNHRLRG